MLLESRKGYVCPQYHCLKAFMKVLAAVNNNIYDIHVQADKYKLECNVSNVHDCNHISTQVLLYIHYYLIYHGNSSFTMVVVFQFDGYIMF